METKGRRRGDEGERRGREGGEKGKIRGRREGDDIRGGTRGRHTQHHPAPTTQAPSTQHQPPDRYDVHAEGGRNALPLCHHTTLPHDIATLGGVGGVGGGNENIPQQPPPLLLTTSSSSLVQQTTNPQPALVPSLTQSLTRPHTDTSPPPRSTPDTPSPPYTRPGTMSRALWFLYRPKARDNGRTRLAPHTTQ